MQGDVFPMMSRGERMLAFLEKSDAEMPHLKSGKPYILPNGDVTREPVDAKSK